LLPRYSLGQVMAPTAFGVRRETGIRDREDPTGTMILFSPGNRRCPW
jgi:hypothetical protein